MCRIDGVMISVLVLSVAYCGFEFQSGQTKDYKIGIWCFSTKNAALKSKGKDWLARNQNNLLEWSDMSTCILLYQWAIVIKSNSAYKADIILPAVTWYRHTLTAHLALNDNHLLPLQN